MLRRVLAVLALCVMLAGCGQQSYAPPPYGGTQGTPVSGQKAAQSQVVQQAAPPPSPWTTPCPQGTNPEDNTIGLCVGAADGYPAACRSPQTVACEHDLAVFACVTTLHADAATVYGNPNDPVYAACSTNPQVQPGVLGVQTRDAPSTYSVHGCEVLHVIPGSAAASAGMVGASDRTDPVGDVIFGVYVAGQNTPIGNCAGLTAALQHTVPGMQVSVSYDHRVVQVLMGQWSAVTSPAVALQ